MKMNLCPHCSGWLKVTKKQCQQCGLQLEADFEENPLVTLSGEEQEFILNFILCGGSFKALAERTGDTYPTLRSYFDRIVMKLETLSSANSVDDILEAIDQGRIRPEEGIEKLKRLKAKEGRS